MAIQQLIQDVEYFVAMQSQSDLRSSRAVQWLWSCIIFHDKLRAQSCDYRAFIRFEKACAGGSRMATVFQVWDEMRHKVGG